MSATINSVGNGLTMVTGSGDFVGNDTPILITPQTDTLQINNDAGILDVSGNNIISISPAVNAVNYLTISNGATTDAPVIFAAGSDTNISTVIKGKGTGAAVLADSTGAAAIAGIGVPSAVNFIYAQNAATTNAPEFQAVGSDTNVSLTLLSKGTGGINLRGRSDGAAAASGYVGEVISTNVPFTPGVGLSNGVITDIATVSLTAGRWRVTGNVGMSINTNLISTAAMWVSLSSATQPNNSNLNAFASTTTFASYSTNVPVLYVNITTTTTVYLSGFANFSSGTCTANGNIVAERIG